MAMYPVLSGKKGRIKQTWAVC